jgi:hypothetical protein
LEHVAGVDDEDGAAITGARFAQAVEIAAEKREAATSIPRDHAAVKVVGTDNRNRDRIGGWARC